MSATMNAFLEEGNYQLRVKKEEAGTKGGSNWLTVEFDRCAGCVNQYENTLTIFFQDASAMKNFLYKLLGAAEAVDAEKGRS